MAEQVSIAAILVAMFLFCKSAELTTKAVDIAVYFETLCPHSISFITEQLYPTYNKVGQIMNITLVPSGNTVERSRDGTWSFDCQHGEKECTGNILATCAIHLLREVNVYLPFINCYEDYVYSERYVNADARTVAAVCAQTLRLNYEAIDQCRGEALGNTLQHDMNTRTTQLTPKHGNIPWVTVRGENTTAIQTLALNNFTQLVCAVYRGPKPLNCL